MIRLARLVSPNSMPPKMAATRSKRNSPTRPQLSPPTMVGCEPARVPRRPAVSEPGYQRMGELARRTGASPELLRAWERRYGLLRPTRSHGGFRLYTAAAASPPLQAAARELAGALDRFDEEQAHAVLDRLLAAYRIETILRDLLVPYLHDLGERWAHGEVSVAQEHFASNLLRGRLLGLARGWGQGHGPAAVLACLPGEQHDLGLIAFGLTLYRRGWRIIYLGPDTSISNNRQATESLPPDLVVLA